MTALEIQNTKIMRLNDLILYSLLQLIKQLSYTLSIFEAPGILSGETSTSFGTLYGLWVSHKPSNSGLARSTTLCSKMIIGYMLSVLSAKILNFKELKLLRIKTLSTL